MNVFVFMRQPLFVPIKQFHNKKLSKQNVSQWLASS